MVSGSKEDDKRAGGRGLKSYPGESETVLMWNAIKRMQKQINELSLTLSDIRQTYASVVDQDESWDVVSAKAENEMQDSLVTLGTRLMNEQIDPEWSIEARATIEAFFYSSDFENITILSLDCRTTLCQLEVTRRSCNAPSA